MYIYMNIYIYIYIYVCIYMYIYISTQPSANLPYPSRKSTLFHMDHMIKQKKCKHSLYLNTAFSFTNNVIFQTLK